MGRQGGAERRAVGVATSRGYSYWFREMLSLCMIDVAHSEIGTEVTWCGASPAGRRRRSARQVAPAPYKQDNRRVDLSTLQPRRN